MKAAVGVVIAVVALAVGGCSHTSSGESVTAEVLIESRPSCSATPIGRVAAIDIAHREGVAIGVQDPYAVLSPKHGTCAWTIKESPKDRGFQWIDIDAFTGEILKRGSAKIR